MGFRTKLLITFYNIIFKKGFYIHHMQLLEQVMASASPLTLGLSLILQGIIILFFFIILEHFLNKTFPNTLKCCCLIRKGKTLVRVGSTCKIGKPIPRHAE